MVKKKYGFHFRRNDNAPAKAKPRLLGIRITASTHVETVCLLELSMFPVTVAGEGK